MDHPTYYFYYTDDLKKNNEIKDHIDFGIIEKLLKKSKFEEKDVNAKIFDNTIDLLNVYTSVPKELYHTQTKLKNYINDLSITNKNNLYNLSYSHDRKKTLEYFMESYEYNPQRNYKLIFKNNQPWYIKLNVAGKGQGNMIINNYNDFLNKLKKVKNAKNGFILNKYIINPLLFKEKKFHIRIFFINYINSMNIKKSYLSRYGTIMTAKNKYISNDFFNKDIHDSHLQSTETDYLFPDDLEKEYGKTKVNDYFKQIKTILKYISDISDLSNYEETKNGYAINGCDFMITSDNMVKLLEINRKTGFYFKTNKIRKILSNYLMKNIYNEVIADVFNLEKVPVEEKFIKL
jgi:DNA-binding protein Fis